jgi:uncharacterized protein (TIGR02117 family)
VLAVLLAWCVVLIASCGLPHVAVEEGGPDEHEIFVVKHGWHAGIVLPRHALPPEALPDFPGVPASPFVEIGWGEASYYPSKDPGTCTLLAAGLWPTSSVVYVVPLQNAAPTAFPQSEQVRIRVSRAELLAVADAVRQSLVVNEDDASDPAAEGHAPGSRFFRSPFSYHAFNNCNHWAAAVLRSAGCSTRPRYTLTVERVMDQARECAGG